jgi:hypothetical protein
MYLSPPPILAILAGCTSFLIGGMSDSPVSSQPGTGMIKMPKPEPLEYWNNGTQSGTGMLPYWTEIQDAGMPMPAALTSMPMPSYANGGASVCSKSVFLILSLVIFWILDRKQIQPFVTNCVKGSKKFIWFLKLQKIATEGFHFLLSTNEFPIKSIILHNGVRRTCYYVPHTVL